jgi:hypothetical protein
MTRVRVAFALLVACSTGQSPLSAHDGPPFPIVVDRIAGPYLVSVWTDPDTTDDGSPGGQFWVVLRQADRKRVPPAGTRAVVAVRSLDRQGPEHTAAATAVRGDIGNQFAAVVMDHEGRFHVRVEIGGPLGTAGVDAPVDATYDRRPAPYLLALYVAPFLLVGLLWGRVLVHRRAIQRERDASRMTRR